MLDIEGLSAGYDGRAVIHGINFSVQPGEIVGLVGANGAGKSTLAHTLSGLLPALGGVFRFEGREITRLSPASRVRLGLIHVPEGRQVFAGLAVAQNLELGGYARQAVDGLDRMTPKPPCPTPSTSTRSCLFDRQPGEGGCQPATVNLARSRNIGVLAHGPVGRSLCPMSSAVPKKPNPPNLSE